MIAVDVTVTEATPVTIPDVPTVATPGALLLHVPEAGVLFNAVVEPAQTLSVPEIAVGGGSAVTDTVNVPLPHGPVPLDTTTVYINVPAIEGVAVVEKDPVALTTSCPAHAKVGPPPGLEFNSNATVLLTHVDDGVATKVHVACPTLKPLHKIKNKMIFFKDSICC